MKKPFIFLGVGLAVVGAIAVVPSLIDWNGSKGLVREQIANATGYDIQIDGNLGFSILPTPYFYVENVKIAPPEGYEGGEFASLDRLDVSVALFPLFAGVVSVDAVKLVNPAVTFEITKDGDFAAINPKLDAMLSANNIEAAPEVPGSVPPVSLNNIIITDGHVALVNHQTGLTTTAKDIDLDLNAKSLNGPYNASGSLDFGGHLINFKAAAGERKEGQSALNLQARINDAADVKYDGVVNFENLADLQGETSITVSSFAALTQQPDMAATFSGFQPATVSGLLTASTNVYSLKNASLRLGPHEFDGNLSIATEPLDLLADFTAKQPVNLNDFLPTTKSDAKPAHAGPGFLAFVPDSVSMPADFTAQISLAAPAALYQTQSFGDVKFTFSKKERSFKTQIAAGKIPGQGSFSLDGSLDFASQSVDKDTNAAVFAEPSLKASVDLKTQNLTQTLDIVPDNYRASVPAGIKSAQIAANIEANTRRLSIKSGSFKTENMAADFSGGYEVGNSSRDKLSVDVAINTLDVAKFQSGKSESNNSLQQILQSLAFPYDILFDVGAQKLIMDGQTTEGVRAQGTLTQNALELTNLSAQNYAGLGVKIDGKIDDLKNLSGIVLNIAGQSDDVKSVMQHFKMDTAALPEKLSAARVNVTANGDVNKLETEAQIQALDASVIAAGIVLSPLTDLKTQDLSLQIKHPNLANFIRALSPGSDYYSGLAKPLDFYADIAVQGKVTSLDNMKTSFAGAPITGRVQYDQSQAVPLLKGSLDIGDLIIKQLTGAADVSRVKAQSFGRAPAGGEGTSSRWSSEPINTDWMRSMNMDLDVKAKSLVYDPWSLGNLVARISLKDGALALSNLKADVLQGQMTGSMNALALANKPLTVQGQVDFKSVSLENLMANLMGSRLIRGQGEIDFKASVNGIGNSEAALISSLAGNADTRGQNIILDGLDLSRFAQALSADSKPGDTLTGLWKGTTSGGSTQFDSMEGVFPINQGIVNIQKLDLLGPQANIQTTGAVNLPRWTIQTAHTITLPKPAGATEAPPPFTINISGSLDNPGQTFGQGAINDYLQRKLQRKVGKELDKVLGDKLGLPPGLFGGSQQPAPAPEPVIDPNAPPAAQQTPEQQPPEQQQEQDPEDALKGILKGLIR